MNMKAMVLVSKGVLNYMEVPDTSPGLGEVKLKIRATGICGSDIPGYLGISGRRIPPMIMGHEFSGEVVALGEGCSQLQVGDRVTVFPHFYCGQCEPCRSAYEHMCVHKRSYGVLETDGAFAEYLCVPEKSCFWLEKRVSYEVGSMAEPLAVGYRAVRKAGDLSGKSVFLVGTGTIGLMALACVASQKPGKVFVSDISDLRLSFAKKVYPQVITINASKEDVQAAVMEHTGQKGAQVCFEAVGNAQTTQQTIDAAGHGAKIVWIGMNRPVIDVSMMSIVTKELQIEGSFLYNLAEFRDAVQLINTGTVGLEPLVSLTAPLSQGPEIMEALAKDSGKIVKAVLVQPDSPVK